MPRNVVFGGGGVSPVSASLPRFNLMDNGAKGDGASDDSAVLVYVLGIIGASRSQIVVTKPHRLSTATFTIPINISLVFEGGSFTATGPYGAAHLVINGPLQARLEQIFDPAYLVVTFGPGRIAEVVPQWWGAVGDGIADDTIAIQAAITAAPAGSIIYFPAGTYKTTAALVAAASAMFWGAGTSVIKPTVALATHNDSDGNPHLMCLYVTGSDVTVCHVTFDASALTDASVSVWAEKNSLRTIIDDSTFLGGKYTGASISLPVLLRGGCDDSKVVNSHFRNTIAAATSQGGARVVFDNNDFVGVVGGGGGMDTTFGVDGGVGCKITNNIVKLDMAGPIGGDVIGVTSGATDCLVSGNVILGFTGGKVIYVFPAGGPAVARVLVKDNYISGMDYAMAGTFNCIVVDASDSVVEGNVIVNLPDGAAGSVGIEVSSANNTVRRNLVNDFGAVLGAAVQGADGTGNLHIEDNILTATGRCVQSGVSATGFVFVRRNTLVGTNIGIDATGAINLVLEDNAFVGAMSTFVMGTKWDRAFVYGKAAAFRHRCSLLGQTTMNAGEVPSAAWGGTWAVGDRLIQSAPAVGQPKAWVCTVAGTFGAGDPTFVSEGNL